ncbi:trehalase-like isoform X2 [Cylas formicarius]|nr:trehalase-like isoform X2 [Cylas formicarius]
MRILTALLASVVFVGAKPHLRHPVVRRRDEDVVQSCPSPVYCQGDLLDTVQLAGVFNDSKTFVDMSQVNSVDVTLANFRAFMADTGGKPTREQVGRFVEENFVSENETVSWSPPDYKSNPEFLAKIAEPEVREFAKNLVSIWPQLGRKVAPEVALDPDRHSIIPVPEGFVVPGGRFRELYYWDTYWIIQALLISEMYDTVRGMLDNFVYLVDTYGFIPNGGRVYYLNRSQPPVFALMAAQYVKATNDTRWLAANVATLEAELAFWLANRTVAVVKDGVTYELARYSSPSNTPRPESYSQDVATCFPYDEDDVAERRCYRALKSGAESGWDFSTRWFFDDLGGTETNLSRIDVERVVPVDLNAILYKAFADVSDFYGLLGDDVKQTAWLERSRTWGAAIDAVLYDQVDGIWHDYDLVLRRPRRLFFPSNFVPLWAGAHSRDRAEEYGGRASAYFIHNGVDEYLGGVPTSLARSGEQWDLPNAWPPLQEFVVLGLLNSGNENATFIANLFANRWVTSTMIGYQENGVMFEKYNAVDPGRYGGGGEYVVQAGFGWTNGVVLNFIRIFFSEE